MSHGRRLRDCRNSPQKVGPIRLWHFYAAIISVSSQRPYECLWKYRNVFDAFEGKEYGAFAWHPEEDKKYWQVPRFECEVTLLSGEKKSSSRRCVCKTVIENWKGFSAREIPAGHSPPVLIVLPKARLAFYKLTEKESVNLLFLVKTHGPTDTLLSASCALFLL